MARRFFGRRGVRWAASRAGGAARQRDATDLADRAGQRDGRIPAAAAGPSAIDLIWQYHVVTAAGQSRSTIPRYTCVACTTWLDNGPQKYEGPCWIDGVPYCDS